MSFVITDVAVGAMASGPLLQGVKVSWLPLQTPQPIDTQTSGNPGYVVGLPLLVGSPCALFTCLYQRRSTTGHVAAPLLNAAPPCMLLHCYALPSWMYR